MNYRKIFTCAFFAFVLCLSDIVNARITEEGVNDAINRGQLGIYLFDENGEDRGVLQFINHTRKHFCKHEDINDDAENETSSTHTVLGNGNWGQGGHKNALRWILNAVTSERARYTTTESGRDLKITGLRVRDVADLLSPVERHKKYVWEERTVRGKKKMILRNRNGEDASDSFIKCVIHFSQDMTGVRYSTNGADGTAGFCYVEA